MKLNIDKATLDFYYCFSIGSRVTTEDFDVTETSHHSPFSIPTKRYAGYKSSCIPIIGSRLFCSDRTLATDQSLSTEYRTSKLHWKET